MTAMLVQPQRSTVKLSHSPAETESIGMDLTATLLGGEIIALQGDLGTGKTTLVKGIAQGLGVTREVTSPTFTLMNVYPVPSANLKIQSSEHKARKSKAKNQPSDILSPISDIQYLIHIDAYRLGNDDELLAIGAEDYLGQSDCVCVIEWPERISGLLKKKSWRRVTLKHEAVNIRKIVLWD